MNKPIYVFAITIEDKNFNFEVDCNKQVWIIENDKSRSNYGQIKPANDLEEAKEIALLMLYAANRIKNL